MSLQTGDMQESDLSLHKQPLFFIEKSGKEQA